MVVGSAELGPWFFASVALVIVSVLAYRLGRRSAEAGAATAPPQAAAEREMPPLQAVPAADTDTDTDPGTGTRPAAAPTTAAADDLNSFSFTVSHDLRAPVRVVEGFARILKEDYGRQLDRIGNDHLERVLTAAARMNAMIDAMLSLARLSAQPIARQPVDLSQLAHWVIEDLRRGAPERSVSVDIEPALQATGDPTLLRQVIENLLANAWKYSSRVEQAQIGFGRSEREGRLVFEVKDNGAGFDMRSAERLFGLFQRLHGANEFPGTGVGLASVRRIVRRHGGDIWAESAPGEGARFYFTLGT